MARVLWLACSFRTLLCMCFLVCIPIPACFLFAEIFRSISCWDISVICLTVVLRLTITVFISLYFQAFRPKWLNFFRSSQKHFGLWPKKQVPDQRGDLLTPLVKMWSKWWVRASAPHLIFTPPPHSSWHRIALRARSAAQGPQHKDVLLRNRRFGSLSHETEGLPTVLHAHYYYQALQGVPYSPGWGRKSVVVGDGVK